MSSALLARHGAVAATGVDAAVASHYGDPFREQRELLGSGGLVDRSHRGVVAVAGVDRLSWLHSLTSQHLETLPPGEVRQALILSPHGHVEHHLVLWDDGATTWLTVEPGTAEHLVEYLRSMRFMLRVEIEDVSASFAVLTEVSDGVARDVLVPRAEVAQRAAASDLPLVGHGAWEARRVGLRVPRLGFETDHRTIPHEVGWIGVAVHLNKGCYRGQETVARVHNLGRPPRRLTLLHLDGSENRLPAVGDPLLNGDKVVGRVGTSARHHELGPIALALVKRNVPVDVQLSVDGLPAAQEVIVDPEVGLHFRR